MTGPSYFTTDDGCRIAWRFDGPRDAPVLLLSNSLGTDMAMWDDQLEDWTRHFRVLRYDSRGHGASSAPPGAYSMDRLGRDVVGLLDSLALAKIFFCGLSQGGMIGQWLGARVPERLDRLVLANTSAYMGPPANWQTRIDNVLASGIEPIAQASIERWFTPSFSARAPDAVTRIRKMLLANDARGYAGCCAAIRDMDMRSYLGLICAPTLIIGGELDPATPPPHSEQLAWRIPAAQLIMLEAAHLSNVELPRSFAQAVSGFLIS